MANLKQQIEQLKIKAYHLVQAGDWQGAANVQEQIVRLEAELAKQG